MSPLAFDIAHMFAGGLVLVSFMTLYQDRLLPLINVLSLHSLLLALSVAWQAHARTYSELYVTAAIALDIQNAPSSRSPFTESYYASIPSAMIRDRHRDRFLTLLVRASRLVGLSIDPMLRASAVVGRPGREDASPSRFPLCSLGLSDDDDAA